MADKKKAPPAPGLVAAVEPRIVAGAASMTGHGGIATSPLAATIERAMSAAVEQALLDGVSIHDSETILKYKHAARAAVLAADRGPR